MPTSLSTVKPRLKPSQRLKSTAGEKHGRGVFFPDGPEADDYVAIRIEPSRMEVLNFSREPFGLKAAMLIQCNGQWQMEG